MAPPSDSKPSLPSFKAGSAAVTGKPPSAPTQARAPNSADTRPEEEPRNLDLLMALEERFEDLPLARSRSTNDPGAGAMKAPVLKDRVISLPTPPPITEQEVLERFAALADPFFHEREREAGEAVALGDAVLVSWEAVVNGSTTPLAREQQVEGRVAPDPALPGFFEGLVGKQVGGRAQFSSVMPQDFAEESARGKRVDFTVEIHQAMERQPPDAQSPEFLQALGYESLEEVMEDLGEQAMQERTEAVERQARMQVYDLLTQGMESALPGDWVELEVREQWKAYRALAQARGEPVPALDAWQADPGLRSEAELRIRLDLMLQAVCARDKVKSGPEDEQKLIEALAELFELEPQTLRAQLLKDPVSEALVKKAAWFIRASEHAMGQVKIQLDGAR